MPAGFNDCMKRGGKVRTRDLGNGESMDICSIDGMSFAGEKKMKKKMKKMKKKMMK